VFRQYSGPAKSPKQRKAYAVIVHPDRRTVLPLDFEPITRADGATKNDCERNAAKRLLERVARLYPKRRFVVV